MQPIPLIAVTLGLASLSACALVTVPVKVAGKVVTTTVGVAGKAASAGIDALKKDDEPSSEPAEASRPHGLHGTP